MKTQLFFNLDGEAAKDGTTLGWPKVLGTTVVEHPELAAEKALVRVPEGPIP